MSSQTFRASAPAGVVTLLLASIVVATVVIFGQQATTPRFIGFLTLGALGILFLWRLARDHRLTLPTIDQIVWAILISHTVLVARYRDPRLLAEGRWLTAEILAEVLIWCACLTYASGRLLGDLTRLKGLWGRNTAFMCLLFGMALVSTLYAVSPMITLAWTFKLLVILLVSTVLFDPRKPLDSSERFLTATYWGLLFMLVQFLVLGLFSPRAAMNQSEFTGILRVGGYLLPSNDLAIVAGMVMVFILISFLAGTKLPLSGPTFLGALILMVVSIGRGGIIATGISICFVLAAFRKKRLAVALAVAFGVILLVTPGLMDLSWEFVSRRQDPDEISSLTGRVGIWLRTLEMIKMKPILGWGYVSGGRVALLAATGSWPTSHSHNVFLEMLLSLGVVGFGILSVLLWRIYTGVISVFRSEWHWNRPTRRGLLALKVLATMIVLCLSGMFTAGFSGPPRYEMVILVGVAFCVDSMRMDQHQSG